MVKTYRPKSLVSGFKVKPELKGLTLVAVPAKHKQGGHRVIVSYDKQNMEVTEQEPLHTQEFQDKFNRGTYFLEYYEWKPQQLTW